MNKITVIGSGYVGLVTGTCFADMGEDVTLVDSNSTKIENLRQGVVPIYEPGLEEMVKRNSAEGRLKFTTSVEEGVRSARFVFIAVGTPSSEDGSADLHCLFDVVKEMLPAINGYTVVVIKSTVPVGTGDIVAEMLTHGDYVVDVVSNPEFLKEGAAISDFMKPDRIVIGAESAPASSEMKRLYAPFNKIEDRVMVVDRKTAELTKYASNAMLATRISFMNELSRLCDALGGDIEEVRRGIGSDPRIGAKFLYPGIGFGGSCFPKDLRALIHMGKESGVRMKMLESVVEVNETQKHEFVNTISKHFGGDLGGKKITVWGLSFKPETDDTRESPALAVVADLVASGADMTVCDPLVKVDGVHMVRSMYDSVEGADALVLATEWREFRRPDFFRIKKAMRGDVIFDGRNVFDVEEVKGAGLRYFGIGRR